MDKLSTAHLHQSYWYFRGIASGTHLCLVDGVVEYGSTSLSDFAHYQLVYAEEHRDADVQYLTLTDEEYDELFPVEEGDY